MIDSQKEEESRGRSFDRERGNETHIECKVNGRQIDGIYIYIK